MKNVIIFIALVVLSRPLWPLVEYTINYEYIVNELCENRDKPEMECNGKCYLTEQLAKEAAGEDKNPFGNSSQKIKIPQYIISENLPEFHFSDSLELNPKKNSGYKGNLYHSLFTTEVLHPPRLG